MVASLVTVPAPVILPKILSNEPNSFNDPVPSKDPEPRDIGIALTIALILIVKMYSRRTNCPGSSDRTPGNTNLVNTKS